MVQELKIELNVILSELNKFNIMIDRHILHLEEILDNFCCVMKNSNHKSCHKTGKALLDSINKLKQARNDINNAISTIQNWLNASYCESPYSLCPKINVSYENLDMKSKILYCKLGEYYYETGNNNSRHAYGQLQYKEKNERKRDSEAQRDAGGDRRRDDDDGGHLIGSRFGGSYVSDNLFPQNRHLNRSAYKALENHWCELLAQGNQVYVDIYTSAANNEMREDSIYGSYIVINSDGTSYTENFSFVNENKETQEQWNEELSRYDMD